MLTSYIRTAFKVLGRRKFFTFISLFGISLTLVVLMVATAILDNFFTPRAPESRFGRVLGVHRVALKGPESSRTSRAGYGFVDRYVRGLPGAEAASIFTENSRTTLYHEGRRMETHVRRTDGAYWQILDFEFVAGGPFREDDSRNARRVAVITDAMSEQLFGSESGLGKSIEFEGKGYRVVGVVKRVPITRTVAFSEIWLPVGTLDLAAMRNEMVGDFGAIVLARRSSDFPRLRREFDTRLAGFKSDDPDFDRVEAGLDTGFEAIARTALGDGMGPERTAILRGILVLAALLFITLPTMNLVSINLSRIMERASEIGVRKAFGASSRALVAQFVVENVVLTLIGGLIGFLLSLAALEGISRTGVLPFAHFDVNLRIFLYGMALAALFGIISGVYPAWRMARMQPVNALRGGAQ
jgi:putative ABC transport system permease protein